MEILYNKHNTLIGKVIFEISNFTEKKINIDNTKKDIVLILEFPHAHELQYRDNVIILPI